MSTTPYTTPLAQLEVTARELHALRASGKPIPSYLIARLIVGIQGTDTPALRSVLRERAEQESRWGVQNHDPVTYHAILSEEVGELAKAAVEARFSGAPVADIRAEAVQVAAVALAIVECLDRGEWRWPGKDPGLDWAPEKS